MQADLQRLALNRDPLIVAGALFATKLQHRINFPPPLHPLHPCNQVTQRTYSPVVDTEGSFEPRLRSFSTFIHIFFFLPFLFPFPVTQISSRKSRSDISTEGQIILVLLSFLPPLPVVPPSFRTDYIRGRIRQVRYHNSGLIFQRVDCRYLR